MVHDPVEEAREWMAQDPDPATRAELDRLISAAAQNPTAKAELTARFSGRLEFGTAGLRGALGAGPTRMNRLMVRRVTAGLAWWMGPETYAVVGFDARHRSADFARDAGRVLNGAEVTALLLPRPLPTPVLAFAVRALHADAGVMITASHNPAQDSGYKVYTGRGAAAGSQIVAPADREISAAIDAVEVDSVDELPLENSRVLSERVVDRYLDAIVGLPLAPDRDVRVAYTPLHGVGGQTFLAAFDRAGFPTPVVVSEQFRPDPDFPTAPMPNPEEPGVMDRVMDLGAAEDCDLVIANDPDADRLAVAVPGRRRLTGDEVGSLLAEHILRHTTGPDRVVATTIVSASQLPAIAREYGARAVETLTGFKWLVRAGSDQERNVFSYEEALGYCVGSDTDRPVADKDGISAALVIASIAAEAKRAGHTLLDRVDDQARRFGLHVTDQVSLRVEELSTIATLMRRLRNNPPHAIGDFQVDQIHDLTHGIDGLPPADVLRYHLSGPAHARVLVRPSGTEPKLKAYLEVVLDPPEDVPAAREEAQRILGSLRDAVTELLGE